MAFSFYDEAIKHVKEMKMYCKDAFLSTNHGQKLTYCAFINLCISEDKIDKEYCVRLDNSGFKIVGYVHNVIDLENPLISKIPTFETIYELLSYVDHNYFKTFSDKVAEKLVKFNKVSEYTAFDDTLWDNQQIRNL